MPLAVLIGLVALPVVLLFLLRVNAALVFLSLCLGNVLVQFAGSDAVSIVSGASSGANLTASTIQLGLLVAPAFLTIIFMMGTVTDKKKFFNIIPAIATGVLLTLLAVPLLPPGLAHNILALDQWQQIIDAQSGVVAASTLVCLVFLWASRPKHDKHGKKHKH
jgi:hypothetical protein